MVVLLMFFFFQAEDGIRDLVRSRGLGDVYKRQVSRCAHGQLIEGEADRGLLIVVVGNQSKGAALIAVSYTHLTLPTSDLV